MGDLPTVKIKHENETGYAIINASDFDPDKHEAFDDEAARAVEAYRAAKAKVHPDVAGWDALHRANANRGVVNVDAASLYVANRGGQAV
jgi:hypothetical protein